MRISKNIKLIIQIANTYSKSKIVIFINYYSYGTTVPSSPEMLISQIINSLANILCKREFTIYPQREFSDGEQ